VEQYLNFIRDFHVLVYQYATSMQVTDDRGPREPWHDLHSKIDGPAAFDVMKNFEERWLKASKRTGAKKLTKSCNDSLLWIEKIPEIAAIDDEIYSSDSDSERWDVQVRSFVVIHS
jgi:phospholipase D1/2